jgi:stage III sporulation protein SpoIIIAA
MDLAFFVVNFGYTKQDFMALTEVEKAFIHKEYERKVISDTTYIRDAVFNGVANAMRKKGSKFRELFKKRQAKADVEFNEQAVDIVIELEEKEGKSWVDKIYAANGMRKPKGGD